MASAAEMSFSNQVIRGLSKDWSTQMLAEVRKVTPSQIREAMKKYMLPAFNPKTANLVITCATIMQESLVANFTEAGFAPRVESREFLQADYGLKAPEGENGTDGAAAGTRMKLTNQCTAQAATKKTHEPSLACKTTIDSERAFLVELQV